MWLQRVSGASICASLGIAACVGGVDVGDDALLDAAQRGVEIPTPPYHRRGSALGGYAAIHWRAARGDADGDGLDDVAIAAGGDLYPQNLLLLPGCVTPDGAASLRGLTDGGGGATQTGTWSSPQFGFFTQVQLADVDDAPGLELVASSLDAWLPSVPTAVEHPTGGLFALRVDEPLGSSACDRAAQRRRLVPATRTLLGDAQVIDFQLADLDDDGRLDLVAAMAAYRPSTTTGAQLRDTAAAAADALRVHWTALPAGTAAQAVVGVFLDRPNGRGGRTWRPWSALRASVTEGGGDPGLVGMPSRVAIADLDLDGTLDVVAAFGGHSLAFVAGPFAARSADLEQVCEAMAPLDRAAGRRLVCVDLDGQMISDLDVAHVRDAQGDRARTVAVVVSAAWCDPSQQHTPSGCRAPSRVAAWWPGVGEMQVLHEAEHGLHTAVALWQRDDGDCGRTEVAFGTAVVPVPGTSPSGAATLHTVTLPRSGQAATPAIDELAHDATPSMPIDLLALPTGASIVHGLLVPASAPRRVALPGGGALAPLRVIEATTPTTAGCKRWPATSAGGVHTIARCTDAAARGARAQRPCWWFDVAARSLVLPPSAIDLRVEYRAWLQPDVLVVDAAPRQPLEILTANPATATPTPHQEHDHHGMDPEE